MQSSQISNSTMGFAYFLQCCQTKMMCQLRPYPNRHLIIVVIIYYNHGVPLQMAQVIENQQIIFHHHLKLCVFVESSNSMETFVVSSYAVFAEDLRLDAKLPTLIY
jgi:hypothetical protein